MIATQHPTICSCCTVPSGITQGITINEKFICQYCYTNNLYQETYCEHCNVIAIQKGDKYCAVCTETIIDYLAMVYQEGLSVEKGVY